MKKRQHAAALLGTLVCLVLALVLYHSLAGGTLMQAGPYNSYALQAENWLAGRNYIANGEDYPWLELAIYSGRYYQSFPPVPAVLMLPFVAAFGSWQALPGGLIMLELALLCAAGVYLCCMRSGMAADVCAYFAVFISMGSNLFLDVHQRRRVVYGAAVRAAVRCVGAVLGAGARCGAGGAGLAVYGVGCGLPPVLRAAAGLLDGVAGV